MSLDFVQNSLKDEDFKYKKKHFMEKAFNYYTPEDWKLCRSKGIFPYEYINSFDKFNEIQFP